jgi:hypothetical protein
MRNLAARNPAKSKAVRLVSMREKYDCLTCITAMLLGIEYDEVKEAFGQNIDPDADPLEESNRLQNASAMLFEKHHCGQLHLSFLPPITEGRRYWVAVRIDDPSNPHSATMTHSIVINEVGRVFDPNPEYGEFESYEKWSAAMTLPHQLEFAVEVYEYSL